MSRIRFTKHAVLALSGVALILGGSAVGSGCTTTTEEIQAADGGGEGGGDAKPKFDSAPPEEEEDSGPGEQTEEECLAECEKKHAAGLTKDKAIDTCWETKCKGPCVDDTQVFDAGAGDGGDAGDAGGAKCSNDVETGEEACNKCTSTFCCAEWDGCFDDQDCSDLNDCRNNCIE